MFVDSEQEVLIVIVVREVFYYEEVKQKVIGVEGYKYDHHLRYSFGVIETNNQESFHDRFVEVTWFESGYLQSTFLDQLTDMLQPLLEEQSDQTSSDSLMAFSDANDISIDKFTSRKSSKKANPLN